MEVLKDDTNIDFDSSGSLSMHAESFLARKEQVFEFEDGTDTEHISCHLSDRTLSTRGPALDLDAMLTGFEGDDAEAIACDRVAPVRICLPDFNIELGPAADRLTFVMKVKRMIPDSEVVDLVSDFLVSLT